MVKIRLKRVGKAKQPSYRVVVADSRSPRDGRIIESIGHYNPRIEPSDIAIDTDRAKYWLDQGARPSEPVKKLLEIALQDVPPPKEERAGRPKATPAASVDQVEEEEAPEAQEPPAELPEAEDQAPAAPEAEAGPETEELRAEKEQAE